jgi:hypothetical protein
MKTLTFPGRYSISGSPNTTFVVIVNPSSGPGSAALPGKDYQREIPKLNSYANVLTVGYVHIDYAARSLDSVIQDVSTYAGWSANGNGGLAVQGIFVDETPSVYMPESAEYLNTLQQYIKASVGIGASPLVRILSNHVT